ncbi:CD1107 family mobile element protein [Clostridium sp. Cult3]|uniref:CD1107 family mobile element protein n=1 Tax=Clostridium sp. Cult3 TaxID=2079004 RepID=UPI001F46A20E|nr:DUF4366 domain-containing protein [Clostridium sp. Cult3]
MNRYIKSVLTLCIVMVLVLLNNTHVFANDDHIAEKSYFSDIIYAADIIGDEKPDESIEIYREEGTISNPQIKEPSSNWNQETNTIISNNGYDVSLVMGGNMDAINPLATKQYIARADMTENVGEDGKEFEMKFDDDENSKQTRQFITFTTKSGKTFHLIVDHEKASQNVFLLTEVGEQDLLNMIEGEKLNTNVKPVVEEAKEEEHKEEENKEIEEKPKEKNKFSFIFVLLILGIVGGGGYYFKIYKPNHEDFEDEDYEDELEYEDEYDEEFGEEV